MGQCSEMSFYWIQYFCSQILFTNVRSQTFRLAGRNAETDSALKGSFQDRVVDGSVPSSNRNGALQAHTAARRSGMGRQRHAPVSEPYSSWAFTVGTLIQTRFNHK